MAFLISSDVRARAQMSAKAIGRSSEEILQEQARTERQRYDVFLSQTLKDEEIVYGVFAMLTEDLGLSVFCDWMAPDSRNHSHTTPEDAAYIRRQMDASDALLLIDSDGAAQSTWMSWELGWFSGRKGKAAIIPIVQNGDDPYRGREFLGLYPVVERHQAHTLEVRVPLHLIAKQHPPGSILGIATKMPIRFWALPQAQLPEPYR